MITQIIGRLVEKTPTQVVIDCNGVGYAVHISLHTFSQIGNDENIKLFTHLQIREDAHTLFGFHTPMERSVFFAFAFRFRDWSQYRSNHVILSGTPANTACDRI